MIEIECDAQPKRRKVLLTRFANGTIRPDHGDTLNTGLLGRVDTTNIRLKEQKILVAEGENMTYVGKNFGVHANSAKGFCRYYAGVLDPDTGKMRVFDTEMFSLQPDICKQDDTTSGQHIDFDQKSYQEKSDSLVSAFGSARSKRALESRKRTTVKTEDLMVVMDSTVDQGLSQISNQRQNTVAESSDSNTLPPCNKEATNVVDVYNLSYIVNEDDLAALRSSAKIFFDSKPSLVEEWRKNNKYPNYILSHLMSLPLDEASRWMRCKLLMYINYLIFMFKLYAKDLRKQNPLPDEWPNHLKKKILDTYSVQVLVGNRSVRLCPGRLKDKIVSHVLVVVLFVDEFCFNIKDLLVDFKMGQDRFLKYCSALGCRTNKTKLPEGGHKVEVVLKLPLVFPSGQKKKKR